jgi:hypothetical protein
MRSLLSSILAASLLLACSSDSGDDDDDDITPGADAGVDPTGELPPPDDGFQIITPEMTFAPGAEETWCYFTTIDAGRDMGIKRWQSRMTAGSHHMIMYFYDGALPVAEGTLTRDCNITGGGGIPPTWTYASSQVDGNSYMPDGVGMTVKASQAAVVQMHYFNSSDSELVAHVTINGHAYAEGTAYQKASPYITFNTQINVPPGQDSSVTGTCAVPSGAKFFLMSTHTHRFGTLTRVSDGSQMILESTDWEHPETLEQTDAPFLEFQNSLTYHCEYHNFTNQTVTTGDSAETDEMCMAVGYFFPATGPVFCLNSLVVPL